MERLTLPFVCNDGTKKYMVNKGVLTEEIINEFGKLEDKFERGYAVSAPDEKDKQIDKFYKISIWILRKYGKEMFDEYGISLDNANNSLENQTRQMINVDLLFDKIYEEMQQEMPLMWYEYCLCGSEE